MILEGYPMNILRVSHGFLVWKSTMTSPQALRFSKCLLDTLEEKKTWEFVLQC